MIVANSEMIGPPKIFVESWLAEQPHGASEGHMGSGSRVLLGYGIMIVLSVTGSNVFCRILLFAA